MHLIAAEVLPKPREISCHWRRLERSGGLLKKGGKRANDSSVGAVHDVPGTPGKHLRAMLQCGSIAIAEGRLCNLLLKPDHYWRLLPSLVHVGPG